MNITEAYAAHDTDAERQIANIDSTKRNTESSGRKYVNVLLDLSEEDYCREHNMHLLQSRTGWEDAVEGWGRFPPFAVPQRNGKNKQDIPDSHCLLCADLKLSDLDVPTPLAKETQNTLSCTSSEELCSFSLSLKNTPGPLISKLLSGDKQCTQKKSPSACHYHTEPCQMLREKTVALSIRSFGMLPPVKESRNNFKRAQVTDSHPAEEVIKLAMPNNTSAVTVIGETGNDLIPGENSYRFKGSPSTKHWQPQDNTQLPSTFNISFQNKYVIPSSTVANTLPQFSYRLGQNLRQEEITKPTTRNNTGYRLYSGHKARDPKRPEAHRLMLIGTRVHMPL